MNCTLSSLGSTAGRDLRCIAMVAASPVAFVLQPALGTIAGSAHRQLEVFRLIIDKNIDFHLSGVPPRA